jgi:hypothetical protein
MINTQAGPAPHRRLLVCTLLKPLLALLAARRANAVAQSPQEVTHE